MDYKILVLDLDGTLTNSKKEISKKTYESLMRIQKEGVKIVLASGRPTYGVMPLARQLNLDKIGGYILSFNGAKVIDCYSQTVLFEKELPQSKIYKIFDVAKKYNLSVMTYENDSIITEYPNDKYTILESKINKLSIKQVTHLLEYIDFPLTKCIITGDGDLLGKIEAEIKAELGEGFNVYRSEPFFLEIMPENIDKAYSLSILLKQINLTKEKMVACGDGYNDLTMIEYAGLGVAMENASDLVKSKADFITKSNDEDGIAYLIQKIWN